MSTAVVQTKPKKTPRGWKRHIPLLSWLRSAGAEDAVGKEHFYVTVREAVAAAQQQSAGAKAPSAAMTT